MNIFIYGSDGFKTDINSVLEHSNIKLRLNDDDQIKVIDTLIELRTAIENYPKDIFLIDDSKIFRKNALNKKMKFLKPSDAVEEEFLKEHGIGDLSINTLEDLPKHILEKIELNSHDDEYENIEESIIEIVDNAYSKEENSDYELDDENVELDDELSSLLSNIDSVDEDELNELLSMEASEELLEELQLQTEEKTEEDIKEIKEEKGEKMAEEFSDLDSINESDMMAALENLDDIDIASITPVASKKQSNASVKTSQSNSSIELNSTSVNELASLITQLLNNKTLEITIKVKE